MIQAHNFNTIIRKNFWSDGLWYAVFLLVPVSLLWVSLVGVLAYGAYNAFFAEPLSLRTGLFFAFFALLGAVCLASFVRSLWAFLTEKFIFTEDKIFYEGFGRYAIFYRDIRKIALRERAGPFGHERMLVFVANEYGAERLYGIPRWHSLSGGMLAAEVAKRARLNLLDHGLLSLYAASHGREWLFPVFVALFVVLAVGSFWLALSLPEEAAGPVVFFWLVFGFLFSGFFFWYKARKTDMVLGV